MDMVAINAELGKHPSLSETVLGQLNITESSGYVEVKFNSIEIGRSIGGESAVLVMNAQSRIKTEVLAATRVIKQGKGVKDVSVVDTANN